jgi:hypothetical protein
LGGKENYMGPFEVKGDQIDRLKPEQLTDLLRNLLWLEASKYNIPRSGIHVSCNICAADGGIDGWIEWKDGPNQTEFIPRRRTGFQCKAKNMGPKDCRKELLNKQNKIKPGINKALKKSGAYIMFCTQDTNTKLTDNRNTAIIQELKKRGFKKANIETVKFYDATRIVNWVNTYLQAQLYVRECLGQTVPPGFRTWNEWSSRKEYREFKYVPNTVLNNYLAAIQDACFTDGQAVIRVTGLSGLGKTRLVYEALNGQGAGEQVGMVLSNKVIYAAGRNDSDVCRFIQEYERWGNSELILVVDECDLSTHKTLQSELEHGKPNIKLITLDYEPEEIASGWKSITIKPKDCEGVVKGILKERFPDLSAQKLRRIEEYTMGFPSIAVLLAGQYQEGLENVGTDKELTRRLLWGREPVVSAQNEIMRICSIFARFQWENNQCSPHVSLMLNLSKTDLATFARVCTEQEQRGILQRRGRYVMVSPVPLAITLASEWLDGQISENFSSIIKRIKETGLLDAFCEQLSKLHFSKPATQIVEQIYKKQGPFGKPETLLTEEGSRVFLALVEVNPQATARAIERCLQSYGRKELLDIKDDIRRNLVWALQRLVWWKDIFSLAGRIILRFAAAENERWSNNATNLFLQLAHVYLPGTQASLKDRFELIREAVESQDIKERTLGIKALGKALESDWFSRDSGVESQGSRMPGKDYEPNIKERTDYWKQCIEVLRSVALDGNEFSLFAAQELAGNFRGMIKQGMLDTVDETVRAIVTANGPSWSDATKAIRDLLDFDGKGMPKKIRRRLVKLETLLSPRTLADRLHQIVSVPDWRNRIEKKNKMRDLSAEEAQKLAEELASKSDWFDNLPILLKGEQRQGFTFGKQLGELMKTKRTFIERCLGILRDINPKNGNQRAKMRI